MLAASLKYPIVIETPVNVQDLIGHTTKEWSVLGNRRAQVIYAGGSKNLETDYPAQINSSSIAFVFRHIDGLNYNCRILFEDSVYLIEGIEKLRRREGYKVTTSRNG